MSKSKTSRRYPNLHITNLDHLLYNHSKGYIENEASILPVNFQIPYPLFSQPPYDGPDIVTSLLEKKTEFLKKKAHARRYVKSCKAELSKSKSGSAFLPMSFLDVYKYGNPDIYFDCDYNFYYTGGCLDYMDFGGRSSLIYPNVDNELCILDLETGDHSQMEYTPSTSVFNLKSMDCSDSMRLTVREKNKITVIQTDSSDDVFKIKFQKESPKIPYVDAKLSNSNKHHLGLLNADFYLKVYDLGTNKSLNSFSKNLCNHAKDCFAQIEFLSGNTLMLANRKELKILDYNSGNIECEFEPELDACNLICCVKAINNTVFVATRHDFMRYDIRNNKEPYEYFSHMLNSPPCYMDILEASDDTFIALSGQKVDQKVLFGCKSINKLPAKIPSVLDTFKECRLRRDILLQDDLDKYLKFSTTGIKLVEKSNIKCLYSLNCAGQIFQQKISEHNYSIYEPIDYLYDWVMKLPKTSNKLRVTGIVEMSDVHSKLLKNNAKSAGTPNRRPNRCNDFLRKFSAIYRKENFCNMTSELMSVWEVEDDFEMETEMLANEVNPTSKVEDWLVSHMFDEDV